MLPLLLSAILLWLVYKWWIKPLSYWRDKGFPCLGGTFPLGSYPDLSLYRKFQGDVITDIYNKMGDLPYAGLILVRRPHLVVKDLNTLKCIQQKDFEHFMDRLGSDLYKDPLAKNLLNLCGDKWRSLRHKLMPAFSSGRIREMFYIFEECNRELDSLLQKSSHTKDPVNVKKIISMYTIDLIASSSFGLEAGEVNLEGNDFTENAMKLSASTLPWVRKLKQFLDLAIPDLYASFNFIFLPENVRFYFRSLIKNTTNKRKETGFRRNDFIDLLLEIRDNGLIKSTNSQEEDQYTFHLSDDDIVAQAIGFLSGGSDTPATALSYALYELAKNQAIQDDIRNKILTTISQYGGITYEAVKAMKFLEHVIDEALRMYPVTPILSRKSTKKYRMPDSPDRVLDEGLRILIPVFALHRDPKYFPEPDKFDPERFSPENRTRIPPSVYQGFGAGPRMCPGRSFGMMQCKTALITILSKYSLTLHSPQKLTFLPTNLLLRCKEPIWLNFNAISQASEHSRTV